MLLFAGFRKLKITPIIGIFFVVMVTDATRDFKKGLALHTSQSCNALAPHTSSSWWYSWATNAGFTDSKGSFCDQPQTAVANARAGGMEFVPMFWGSNIPTPPFDAETEANLQAAMYLLTFNEPEQAGQSDILPAEAALLWPQVEAIAAQYSLQLVAPCTTGDNGLRWYSEWLANCTTLYGTDSCSFDFVCVHLYYQPWVAALGSCAPGVYDWACIGNQAAKAVNKINQWYTTYGKQIWVTEFACAPWGGADCDEAKHTALMEQMLPVLDNNPAVFRYAWYSMYDGIWIDNSLNELVWEKYPGQACPGKKWLKGFGTATWQIQTLHECVAAADAHGECVIPLSLSIDEVNCYCATDTCDTLSSSYSTMKTYKEVGPRNSDALTALGVLYNNHAVSCVAIAKKSTCNSTPGCQWRGSRRSGTCNLDGSH
jgi:hypothetical protein